MKKGNKMRGTKTRGKGGKFAPKNSKKAKK